MVFDVSNVYFVWDDNLSGKTCYFADSVMGLVNAMSIQNIMNIGIVEGFGSLDKPFSISSRGNHPLVYPIDNTSSWAYNKAYVKFEWDDSLEDKKCLLANSIGKITSMVCRNVTPWEVFKTGCNEHPFKDEGGKLYKFAYFDPYYDFRYSFLNGEPVEFKWYGEWQPLKHCMFALPPSHYRVKYENSPTEIHEGTRPVKESSKRTTTSEKSDNTPQTYLELAGWLSEGRGYCHDIYTGKVITHFPFDLVAKDCHFNESRYHLIPWDAEISISDVSYPSTKCGFDKA